MQTPTEPGRVLCALLCLLLAPIATRADFDEDVVKSFPNVGPKDQYMYIPAIKRFAEAMMNTTGETVKQYALDDEREPFLKRFFLEDAELEKPLFENEVTVELLVFDELVEGDSAEKSRRLDELSGSRQTVDFSMESVDSNGEWEEPDDAMDFEQRRVLERVKAQKKLRSVDGLGLYFPVLQICVGLGDYDQGSPDIWNRPQAEERRLRRVGGAGRVRQRRLMKVDVQAVVNGIQRKQNKKDQKNKLISIQELDSVIEQTSEHSKSQAQSHSKSHAQSHAQSHSQSNRSVHGSRTQKSQPTVKSGERERSGDSEHSRKSGAQKSHHSGSGSSSLISSDSHVSGRKSTGKTSPKEDSVDAQSADRESQRKSESKSGGSSEISSDSKVTPTETLGSKKSGSKSTTTENSESKKTESQNEPDSKSQKSQPSGTSGESDLDEDSPQASQEDLDGDVETPKRRVALVITEFLDDTLGTVVLGRELPEMPELLRVDDNELDPLEESHEETEEDAQSPKQEAEFDVFMEGVSILEILSKKAKFLATNGYFADLDADSLLMKEVPESMLDFVQSDSIRLYSYEDKRYNMLFKSVHDAGTFAAFKLFTLRFVPDANLLKQMGALSPEAIMLYGLGMLFIEFYLARSGQFAHTRYVNEVFSMVALSGVDQRVMESLDYSKLGFLFPEQSAGEDEEALDGTRPQGYAVKKPLLFNFMNFLLKRGRAQDKDDFLGYVKSSGLETVTSEMIEELLQVNRPVTESFLRFLFYSRFERLFIDSEKGRFVGSAGDLRARVDALDARIGQLNQGLAAGVSLLLDMVEEVKAELAELARQSARNEYVDVFMNAMRNVVLGYHVSAENLKYLDDSLQRLRQAQERWAAKIAAIPELEGKDFEFLKVQEYLGIQFNEPVSREDSFRLLVV